MRERKVMSKVFFNRIFSLILLDKQKTSGSKTKFQKRRAAKKVSRDRNSMISSLLLSECELLELEIEEYSTKPEKSLDVSYIINTSPTDFPVDNPNLGKLFLTYTE